MVLRQIDIFEARTHQSGEIDRLATRFEVGEHGSILYKAFVSQPEKTVKELF